MIPSPPALVLNMKRNLEDPTHPATFHYNNAHVISLTIFPKASSTIMDVTTKLQHEVRMVVAGTRAEIFLLPCKYTAIRCSHLGMEQTKFTYDPEKPSEQLFLPYSIKKPKFMKREMPSETSVKKDGNLMVGIDAEKDEVTCR